MLPPGLAFVSVSEKAWKKIDATPVRSFYLDLRRYKKSLAESDTPFTPGEHADPGAAGEPEAHPRRGDREPVGAAREDRGRVPGGREGDGAGGLRRAAEQRADGHHGARRESTARATLKKLEKQYGYKLADGQDTLKGKIWRLSHMGYTDAFDVLGALSALELVLLEWGFKLEPGAGVAAFQRAYAACGAKAATLASLIPCNSYTRRQSSAAVCTCYTARSGRRTRPHTRIDPERSPTPHFRADTFPRSRHLNFSRHTACG